MPSSPDNPESLHRILRVIFFGSIIVLILYFLSTYYDLAIDSPIFNRTFALVLLGVSLLGASGRKDPDYTLATGLRKLIAGLALYFAAAIFHLFIPDLILTATGFLLILHGGNYLSRIVWRKAPKDIFNRLHETFPQEERLLENEFSVNLAATYHYDNSTKASWINIVNPFRGTLILGLPGSGKTRYIIRTLIRQQIQKGFSMLVYDFKYDDLSKLAYDCFERYKSFFPVTPAFFNIHFDDLNRSHRCNPLAPETLNDIMDAAESARSCLLGMNREWISKQGDFFVESPINFMTALIWFLRCYEDGQYCTLPHVIELAQVNYKHLFTILRAEPEIQALVNPFINNALLHGTMQQLDGQIASANISLAKLSSPNLYYILTGNDFSLDLNDPQSPKILTLGNTPQKSTAYAPVLSLFLNTINRLCNRKDKHPFAEVLDEFSTIFVHSIDKTIATGRSNKIAVTLSAQDASQLRLAYGREFADVILHTCGNILSGQNTGDTAKWLSERFGKTMQDRQSLNLTAADSNLTLSHQLEPYIPISRISTLSAGEFVGLIADNPNQSIDLKAFCARITLDEPFMAADPSTLQPLPILRDVTPAMIDATFRTVKSDITRIVRDELARISDTAELQHLIIN